MDTPLYGDPIGGMTLPEGRDLSHTPQYFPQEPDFPLPKELSREEEKAGLWDPPGSGNNPNVDAKKSQPMKKETAPSCKESMKQSPPKEDEKFFAKLRRFVQGDSPRYDTDSNYQMRQMLNESEDLRQMQEEMHRFWFEPHPSALTYSQNGAYGPSVPRDEEKPKAQTTTPTGNTGKTKVDKKLQKLLANYRKACEDGDTAKAKKTAIKALELDPMCFSKPIVETSKLERETPDPLCPPEYPLTLPARNMRKWRGCNNFGKTRD